MNKRYCIMTRDVKITFQDKKQVLQFVQMNSSSSCQIDVRSGHSYIDGKSMLGLLSLNLFKPLYVSVIGDSNKISDLINDYEESNLVAS